MSAAATSDHASGSITSHWHELVTVALLGTDRRDPPLPPAALADVVDDALDRHPAARMLTAVGASVVARRVGVRPGPPATTLQAPPPDRRPMVSPAAAARWRRVIAEWPVLEDEYWAAVRRRRRRVPPDLLVAALRRHRRDGHRWGEVMAVGGPAAAWLVNHRPGLGRGDRSAPVPPERGLDELPALPVAPELVGLLSAGERAVVAGVVGLLVTGRVTMAHRNVLVNFVARCRPDVLPALAAALVTDVAGPGATLALALADLATTRHDMLAELDA